MGSLGFENAYTLAMDKALADELGVKDRSRSCTRCAAAFHRRRLRIFRTAGVESAARDLWSNVPRAAADAAGIHVCRCRSARRRCHCRLTPATAACAIRTRGSPTDNAIPPYDAIILVSPKRANDAALYRLFDRLLDAISSTPMREANRRSARMRRNAGERCTLVMGADRAGE